MILGSVEKHFDIMLKWNLTGDEYLFLQMIFLAKESDDGVLWMHKYLTEVVGGFPKDIITILTNKRIINKPKKDLPDDGETFKIAEYIADYVEFNKTFIKSYYKLSDELGNELWETYPSHCTSKSGEKFPMRGVAKSGYRNMDEFSAAYAKIIKYDLEVHNTILELVEEGKKRNLIRWNLGDFISFRRWKDLQEILASDIQDGGFVDIYEW